ncbi:MAG: hypothetical protein QOF78_3426 [Phycisphaerales bacterium]|jgi:hypothetical protein|nr:hypothetical protein [Phycisphaerales bacterium]
MRTLVTLIFAVTCFAATTSARAASAAPASVPVPATQPGIVVEKCHALAAKWRARFDAERMTCIVSPPFVVAGDGGRQRLNGYVDHTIRGADDALRRKFFDRARPTEPILMLLFESAESYKRLAKKWLDDEPSTPYGYFRRDNIMVMNVGTGTGTLVHELVHAVIRPDFPGVPDWFNEGLGSLFEQCTLADGDIRGLENWRLPALQRAIRAKKLRPLRELIEDPDFYGDKHVGLNYAQARYLLMYLQEQGKLADFYKKLRADHDEDKHGLATLKAIIAPQALEEFEKEWRAWVLELRFAN